MSKARHLVLLVLAILAVSTQLEAATEEYIIVSGGVSLNEWEKYKSQPHDRWWLNFIRAARIRIQELQAEARPGRQITWMVFAPAYERRQKEEAQGLFSIINSVRDTYGVKLIYFRTSQQLVNYINNGQPRQSVKITGFEYFGHSNKACFMFDYSNEIDSASKEWLHENDLYQLQRQAFARNAYVKSWGCHTGESMSQKWRQATGTRMFGAVGKTQYQTHTLPTLSSAGGRWVD